MTDSYSKSLAAVVLYVPSLCRCVCVYGRVIRYMGFPVCDPRLPSLCECRPVPESASRTPSGDVYAGLSGEPDPLPELSALAAGDPGEPAGSDPPQHQVMNIH